MCENLIKINFCNSLHRYYCLYHVTYGSIKIINKYIHIHVQPITYLTLPVVQAFNAIYMLTVHCYKGRGRLNLIVRSQYDDCNIKNAMSIIAYKEDGNIPFRQLFRWYKQLKLSKDSNEF